MERMISFAMQRLEVRVVSHCNLRCVACSHLSPVMPKFFYAVKDFQDALAVLTSHVHVRTLRFLGGEPLLHPDLPSLLTVARSFNIGTLEVVTNGTLLNRMDDFFWRSVDSVEVSLYPSARISLSDIGNWQHRAKVAGTKLRTISMKEFQESYSEAECQDSALVQSIFRTCQIGHIYQCVTLHENKLYRCPQSSVLEMVNSNLQGKDSLELSDSGDFGDRLLEFLLNEEPLAACRHCTGSVGKRLKHGQLSRDRWRSRQNVPLEGLIDRDELDMRLLAWEGFMAKNRCCPCRKSGKVESINTTTKGLKAHRMIG